MNRAAALLLLAAAVAASVPAEGRERSATARAEFRRANPCPATGRRSGACPGHVIDHIEALDCGGADAPFNMQWQTRAAAKAKDRVERSGPGCAHRTKARH